MSANDSESDEDFWGDDEDDVNETSMKLDLGKGRKGLQQALNLTNAKEWRDWLVSQLVKPFWIKLWDDCLKQEAKGGARGIGLGRIQELIAIGESGGRRKYSNPFRDQTGWETGDHMACFLYWVKRENMESNEGVFYGKGFSDDDMDRAVWALKGILTDLHSPSQIKNPMGGTALFGTVRGESAGGGSVETRSSKRRKLPDNVFDDRGDDLLSSLSSIDSETQKENDLALISSESEPEWMKEVLSPTKKVMLTRHSETYNATEPFWKVVKINQALHLTKVKTLSAAEQLVEMETDGFIDKLGRDIKNHVFDRAHYEAVQDYVMPVTVETTTDELLNITQEDVADLRQQEKWLDNEIYQPDNHEQACERLGILDPQCPRLPGMVRSAVLKFWQPCAIWRIVEIMLSKQTRGAMIADSMGLGKTWEAIGVILARARQIELAIDRGEDVQRKPTMVVVPPHLIEQWTDELGTVSGSLKFSVYYGDNRRQGGSSVHIQGRLSSKHKIFGKNYDGTYTVVLTTYNTLEARHGLSAVTQWHKEKYSRNYQPGDTLPDDFPGNLKGCFGLVICDEAQYVRNEGSGISLSVWWLQSDFNLLMTGTPFFNNRNRDMLGYSKLLLLDYPAPESLSAERLMEIVKEDASTDSNIILSRNFFKKYIMTDDLAWGATAMRALLRKLMVRRTMASSLPIGSNRTIGKDIPPAKKKILYCPMTDEEDEAYNTYWAKNSRVMTLDRSEPGNPKYRWNMEKLRKLVMGSSWLGFIALEKTVTAKSMPKALNALRRNTLIPKFLDTLRTQKAVSDEKAVKGFYRVRHAEAEKSESDSGLVDADNLAGVIRGSPKMRTMLGILRDQVLLRNEKAMVWTFFPGEELYVCAVLKEAGIDVVMLHAGLEHKERAEIVRTFNGSRDKMMVLVVSYLVNSAGLNLQRYCHHVHLFSVAMTRATADQAIGRAQRVGQDHPVIVLDYRVPNTFSISLSNRATQKALPGVLTDMCGSLASILEPDKEGMDANRWVLRENKLKYLEDGETKFATDDDDPNNIIDAIMRSLEGGTVGDEAITPSKRGGRRRRRQRQRQRSPTDDEPDPQTATMDTEQSTGVQDEEDVFRQFTNASDIE